MLIANVRAPMLRQKAAKKESAQVISPLSEEHQMIGPYDEEHAEHHGRTEPGLHLGRL